MRLLLPPSCCDLSQRGLAFQRPISDLFHASAESAQEIFALQGGCAWQNPSTPSWARPWMDNPLHGLGGCSPRIQWHRVQSLGPWLLPRKSLKTLAPIKWAVPLVLVDLWELANVVGVVGELDNNMSLLSQLVGWTGGFPLLCSATRESRHQVKRLHWLLVVTECPHGHCEVIVPGVSFRDGACPQECLRSLSFLLCVLNAEWVQGVEGFDSQLLLGFAVTGFSKKDLHWDAQLLCSWLKDLGALFQESQTSGFR